MPNVGFPNKRDKVVAVGDLQADPDEPAGLDPRDELASIVSSLKAHLLWQSESGASGIPRGAPGAFADKAVADASPPAGFGATPRAPKGPPTTPPHRGPTAVRQGAPGPRETPAQTPLPVLPNDLEEVRARVAACVSCELHSERKQTVFSRGTGSSGLCFVGEGPGAEEDAQGEPFVGPAGQLLDKMIEAMGLGRDEVYICNIVKCRPPNNRRPTPVETNSCIPYLHKQLELMNPQVIVALGGTAVAGLLGITEGITRVRGKFRLYQSRIAVMPTFHPAYLLRNPAAKREVWADLRQVLAHMGRDVQRKS